MTNRDLFGAGAEPVARKEYYSIGEVSALCDLKPHVLRYWEEQFEALRPAKNRAGKRVFRPHDVEVVLHVRRLLHEEMYTIEGARKKLSELLGAATPPGERRSGLTAAVLADIRAELLAVLGQLSPPEAALKTSHAHE